MQRVVDTTLVLVGLYDRVLRNDEEAAGDLLRLAATGCLRGIEGLVLRVSQLVYHLLRSSPLV